METFSNYMLLLNSNISYIDLLACEKCTLISSPIVSYEQLMNIETKYLRLYLINRKVSILGYNEKKDLATLIINYNCFIEQNNPINFNITENVRNANSDTLNEAPLRSTESLSSINLMGNVNGADTTLPSASLSEAPFTSTNSAIQETNLVKRHASLSDLSSIDDISALSVRQIKEILSFNFVNYGDCFEKNELVERLKRLYNDTQENKIKCLSSEPLTTNTSSKAKENSQEPNLCKICMDNEIDCVLLNCGIYFQLI